jgi:hypothetical protein
MADAHLSLTRRALLAGACTVLTGATRHPGQGSHQSSTLMGSRDPGPTLLLTAPGKDRWMPDPVRHDGSSVGESFVVTNWDRVLKRYQKAEAALTAAAHTEDETLYDRLGTRHEAALQRLLLTPAPTIAALALKLDLALYEDAVEFIADLPAMRALKQDALRLAASAA